MMHISLQSLIAAFGLFLGAMGQSIPITCSGICPPGDDLLNAGAKVEIGNEENLCGIFDLRAKETIDPEVCTQWQDDAATAGCKCGIPIECSGICPPGDQMLNAGANVKIGNEENLCGIFDLQAKETIDPEACNQWQVDAATAGCKCGIPIECSGICPPGDDLLNAGSNVEIGNEENLCGIFDLRAKETIDPEVCTQWQDDAATAGCKCGIPIECSGICPPGDDLLNAGSNVKIGNEENLCGIFDLRAKETIDAEVCNQWQVDADVAGCKCGISGEPTNAGGSMSISIWSGASALAVAVATMWVA